MASLNDAIFNKKLGRGLTRFLGFDKVEEN